MTTEANLKEIRNRAKMLEDMLLDRELPFDVEIDPHSDQSPPKETMQAYESLAKLLQNPDFFVWFAYIRQRVEILLDKVKPDSADESTMRYALSLRYFATFTAKRTVEFVESIESFLAKRQAWEASKTANPGVHTTPPAP